MQTNLKLPCVINELQKHRLHSLLKSAFEFDLFQKAKKEKTRKRKKLKGHKGQDDDCGPVQISRVPNAALISVSPVYY